MKKIPIKMETDIKAVLELSERYETIISHYEYLIFGDKIKFEGLVGEVSPHILKGYQRYFEFIEECKNDIPKKVIINKLNK